MLEHVERNIDCNVFWQTFCRLRFSKAKIASGWQRIISKACLDSLLLSSLVD